VLISWLLRDLERKFSDTKLRLENFADVSTECLSRHQAKFETSAKLFWS